MKTPKHLWAGDWQAEAEALREERKAAGDRPRPEQLGEAVTAPETVAIEEPPRGSGRRWAWLLGGVAVVAIAVAGAFLLGGELSGDDSDGQRGAGKSDPTITAPAGQTQAGAIYAMASPAVVSLRAGTSTGSGFLIDADGTVVTNAHVVDGASAVNVRFGADDATIRGEVLGSDAASDLAVVRIDPASVPPGTKPLSFTNSNKVAVGDAVIAIGNPFGSERTETTGIVSGVERYVQAPNGFQISEAIQTDATINRGNSGGPLLDDAARVVGVTSKLTQTGRSSDEDGIGFAVTSNIARQVVPVLKEGGTIERPWLGVSTTEALTSSAARVVDVVPGGPADDAGLRKRDLITAVDGDPVAGGSDLGQLIEDATVGSRMVLQVERSGQPLELDVVLRQQPTEPQ